MEQDTDVFTGGFAIAVGFQAAARLEALTSTSTRQEPPGAFAGGMRSAGSNGSLVGAACHDDGDVTTGLCCNCGFGTAPKRGLHRAGT
ncbi:hypothetical protein [Pseudarthrobacter sp. S9]|uniref:hypothetical protein n=1 Tax=Pseudarthrobacter sp. S9 TaxID=3418421 RepID=UPI003D08217B